MVGRIKQNNRAVGGEYEVRAAAFLEQSGFVIAERNFRCRLGEIDLIARDGACLVFVEVKYRKSRDPLYPLAAVGAKKQRTISRVAAFYLLKTGLGYDVPCRFDIVAFSAGQLTHIRNAFDFQP